MRKVMVLLSLLVLTIAACGDGDAASGNGNDLPDTDDPGVSGACLPEDPDCEDIGDPNADPGAPTDASDEPITPSEALTVDEVLAAGTIDGPFVVTGYLFINAQGDAQLCSAIAESFPPQCGGESIAVLGDIPMADDLSAAQGLRWSDNPVQLEGTFDGTTFTTQ